MKTMIGLICSTVLAGCALDGPALPSEDSQGLTATNGSATTAAGNVWLMCENPNLTGVCQGGPVRIPALQWPLDNSASSIQTNGTAMETWNDPNFKGTYGYFAPWGTWNSLSAPYNDAISSISYPGV